MNFNAKIPDLSKLGARQRKAMELKAQTERAAKGTKPGAGSLNRKVEELKAQVGGTAQAGAGPAIGGSPPSSSGNGPLPGVPGADILGSLAGEADGAGLGARQLKAAALKAEFDAKLRQQAAATAGGELIRFEDAASFQSLLNERGLSMEAVWSHEQNASLRAKRESADALQPGDEVFVPSEPEEEEGGPVGQGEYIVKQGDCTNSIAKDTGHFWETIWNEPANEELREVRKNPNILLPEDRVTIPPLTPKQEPGEAEKRNRFVRRGEPSMLRVRVLEFVPDDELLAEGNEERQEDGHGDAGDGTSQEDTTTQCTEIEEEPGQDRPRANVPYTVDVDGAQFDGTTDPNGFAQIPIPGNAQRAVLRVGEAPDIDEYEFDLGGVDPISEITGVQQRLNNLDFVCGTATREMTDHLRSALMEFQRHHGLAITGEINDDTRNKLVEVHGS